MKYNLTQLFADLSHFLPRELFQCNGSNLLYLKKYLCIGIYCVCHLRLLCGEIIVSMDHVHPETVSHQ